MRNLIMRKHQVNTNYWGVYKTSGLKSKGTVCGHSIKKKKKRGGEGRRRQNIQATNQPQVPAKIFRMIHQAAHSTAPAAPGQHLHAQLRQGLVTHSCWKRKSCGRGSLAPPRIAS
jgi:hypothetical protein